MRLANQFPKEAVQKRYGVTVTDQFLDHVRLSSVRFNNGGSIRSITFRGCYSQTTTLVAIAYRR